MIRKVGIATFSGEPLNGTLSRMTTTAARPEVGRPSQLIAAEIRAELARRQVSYRQLAAMIPGVSYAWVNRRISACDVDLTFEDAQLIANAIGVPVKQFLIPVLEHAPSPTGRDTGAYPAESNTPSDCNVVTLPVSSIALGDRPGVMRTTRTAA